MKKRLITHRCEGSLKNKVSIRYTKQFSCNIRHDYEAWRLFKLECGEEYDNYYLSHISEINYCPFCQVDLATIGLNDEFEKAKNEIESKKYEIINVSSPLKCDGSYLNKDIGSNCIILDFKFNSPLILYIKDTETTIQAGNIKEFKIEKDILTIDAEYYIYTLKAIE